MIEEYGEYKLGYQVASVKVGTESERVTCRCSSRYVSPHQDLDA